MSTSWIIASGKGGVGKSTLCAGLGEAMAREGRRVCIIDADIGLRDQDVLLGLQNRVMYDLLDVLGTPVSPELLPPKDGEISQKTEELVGPYELHDFYLYYMLRYGMPPRKIFRMACHVFAGEYDRATVKRWLVTFLRRFFMQQFKRSCLPDGPKVGTVGVSPRGDWRMPTDAVSEVWLREAEALM